MRPDAPEPDSWEAYVRRQMQREILRKPRTLTEQQIHELQRKIMAAIFDEKVTARVCCPVCAGEGRISIAPDRNS